MSARKRLPTLLASLTLAPAVLVGTAAPADAACPVKSATSQATNAVPATIDGHIEMRTDYYNCVNYVIVSSRKWDQFSGPAVRGYYNANIEYWCAGVKKYWRTNFSVTENTWVNMTDFQCAKPALMAHHDGSRSDVIAYLDGTVGVDSHSLN